jgi:hypothetical protein
MRGLVVGFALMVTTALGCSGKPADQPGQGAPEPPKQVARTQDRIRPVALTAEDWKAALAREYPAVLREGMSDEQLAKDLERQAWAFEFTGGPLRCWVEVEEAGQETMPPRQPSQGEWECDAREGRCVFSVGREASERMKRIMQKLGKDAHSESVTVDLRFRSPADGRSGSFGASHGGPPLWYGWPGEKSFAVRADPVGAATEEVFTIVRLECAEPAPAKKDAPRKVVLVLKGVFGKSKKE